MKKHYTAPEVLADCVLQSSAICKGSRHDNGVGDNRGQGYDEEWEHREFPWDDPHL